MNAQARRVPRQRIPWVAGAVAVLWTPLTIAVVMSLATPAVAQVAMPELIMVVDDSSSMQNAIGIQEAADCTGKKVRSRFGATMEMIAGTRAGAKCVLEALPTHPDSANPPKQQTGGQQCIPGLSHTLAETQYAPTAASESKPIGEKSWANNPLSGPSELNVKATIPDTVLPYFSFDLDSIPKDKGDWVGGGLTVYLKTPDTLHPGTVWTYLALVPISPSGQSGLAFVCGNDVMKPAVVSAPTKVGGAAGAAIRYSLTTSAITALRKAVDGGQKTFHFTIISAVSWMLPSCGGRGGDKNDTFDAVLHGPAAPAGQQPTFDIRTGTFCYGEGPENHARLDGMSNLDGVIDVFGPVAKFALLMSDSVMGTTKDEPGGFSFGNKFTSYWGDINLGIADPYAKDSPSVPITGPDTLKARQDTYYAIKDRITKARPVGGTPMGGMLKDVDDYLGPSKFRDPHFTTTALDPVNGDPFYDCRQRVVIVFSDGGANQHNGTSDGRQEALAAAANLWLKGVPVYVAAVGHTNVDANNPPPTADLDFLHALAVAGGTKEAWLVEKPADIIAQLKPVIAATGTVGQVLTRAQSILPRVPREDVQYSFHARSLFDIIDPLNTRGDLEQRVYSCEGKCTDPKTPDRAQVCEVLDYSAILAARTEKRAYLTNIAGEPKELQAAIISPKDMGIPTTGLAPKLIEDVNGNCVTQAGTFNLSQPTEREDYRDHLLSVIRADKASCRKDARMGAVARSQPAVLESADKIGLREQTYRDYVSRATPAAHPLTLVNLPGSRLRPTMLFAATHDGLLHAFRADRDKNITLTGNPVAGDEMWTWLPAFNLRRVRQLKLVTTADGSYLGGHVVARHVQLQRVPLTPKQNALMWRAVVAVGAGEAGAGYMALDVTVPHEPKLLWEITPDQHCWGSGSVGGISGPACTLINTFGGMGRSTARPVIGTVFMEKNNISAEMAVAIIVSGKPPVDSQLQNIGTDGTGKREVYVISMINGELIRKFSLADMELNGITTTVNDPANELGHFWTEPACYSEAPGQLLSRCFIGDSKGMVWRLDLSSKDPTKWQLQWFHDAYSGADTPASFDFTITDKARVPILTPPSLANSVGLPSYVQTNRTGRLVVVYGTGGPDDVTDAKRHHLVYSVAELFTIKSGKADRAEAVRIWVQDLGDGARYIGPGVVFDSNSYWATYTVSKSGSCTVGSAHVWGGRFDRRRSVTVIDKLLGAFPNPNLPNNEDEAYDKIPLGLLVPSPVDVQPVPGCVAGCTPGDFTCYAGKGGLGGAAPNYEVVTGNAGSDQGKSQAPKTGNQPKVGTRVQKLKAPRSTAMVTGWDVLLD